MKNLEKLLSPFLVGLAFGSVGSYVTRDSLVIPAEVSIPGFCMIGLDNYSAKNGVSKTAKNISLYSLGYIAGYLATDLIKFANNPPRVI